MSEGTGYDIRRFVGKKKILTADEVKKLPAGTKIRLYGFDRHGSMQYMEYTVVKSGKKMVLVGFDYWRGMKITKQIGGLREGRQCYTEV